MCWLSVGVLLGAAARSDHARGWGDVTKEVFAEYGRTWGNCVAGAWSMQLWDGHCGLGPGAQAWEVRFESLLCFLPVEYPLLI